MRKILYTTFFFVFAALGCEAQFLGYVSPQGEYQVLAPAATACTGLAQNFPITNLGQTQHYISVSALSNIQQFQAEIDGYDALGNVYRISDVLDVSGSGALTGTLRGKGFFPVIKLKVTCTPAATASFAASYSGCSSCTDDNVGNYLQSQVDKVNFSSTENANHSDFFQTPYASSAGVLYVNLSAAAAGGSITVACSAQVAVNSGSPLTVFSAPLANATGLQTFQIPDFPCLNGQVSYANNGASGTITAEYVFAQPGRSTPSNQYTHITGTTATVVKGTAGVLHVVSINSANAVAGTVSLFDLAAASCTGTPATNTVAVITTPASTTALPPFVYDVNFLNGICVKASAAMDITVSAQ